MEHLECLYLRLHALVIFRELLEDEVISLLCPVLFPAGKSMAEKVDNYARFASKLFAKSENLTDYIWDRLLLTGNPYIQKCARREEISPALTESLLMELKTLEELSQLNGGEIQKAIGYEGYLPAWETRPADFIAEYQYRAAHVLTLGYGLFAKYHMFTVKDTRILPAGYPDPIRLAELKGYEREQKLVVDNTLALLCGKPAANTLLYGDAGTGKSSTVKAIANEYCERGLRLVELKKNQLTELPAVLEELCRNPLKFILFIDDLTFSPNEDIGTLKAVLEGTVSARSKNVVLYATSNRRHLIHETFSARGEDDIHANETIQEQVSLSDRFGLTVGYFKPEKDKYLHIVHALAMQWGIKDTDELDIKAERHALERGGRSPRVARQFVEYMKRMEE